MFDIRETITDDTVTIHNTHFTDHPATFGTATPLFIREFHGPSCGYGFRVLGVACGDNYGSESGYETMDEAVAAAQRIAARLDAED